MEDEAHAYMFRKGYRDFKLKARKTTANTETSQCKESKSLGKNFEDSAINGRRDSEQLTRNEDGMELFPHQSVCVLSVPM